MADATAHSSERVLTNQTEEEVIEIDENGVVHAVGYTPRELKSTVLRDPEGEYAVIEIGSDQLTLTPSELLGNRWACEQQKLRVFPAFRFLSASSSIVAAEGALDTQCGNTYGLRIELNNYPFSLPKIRPKDWTIHPSAPHQFNDGSICVMRSDQWHRHFTVALVIAKAAIWLGKYEIWKRNGNYWPGLGQSH